MQRNGISISDPKVNQISERHIFSNNQKDQKSKIIEEQNKEAFTFHV